MLAAGTLKGLSQGLAAGLSFPGELAKSHSAAEERAETPVTELPTTIDLEELIPKFAAGLRDRLRGAGIDPAIPFTLKEDGNGGLLVDGDHPHRAAIEDLLAQDSELLSQFQEIAREANQRRNASPAGLDDPFAEFRLSLSGQTAAIYFE
jgi:hypothetical protein